MEMATDPDTGMCESVLLELLLLPELSSAAVVWWVKLNQDLGECLRVLHDVT